MHASKSRRGSAYISVLATTMLIIVLAAIALSVTTVSRRITARYSDYIGLYDLAVAGNEQALLLLLQALDARRADISRRAWLEVKTWDYVSFVHLNNGLSLGASSRDEFRRIFIEKAMADLRASMGSMFSRYFFKYQLTWGLDATIGIDGHTVSDSYRAVTTLCAAANRFHLDTVIHRYIDGEPGIQAIVDASINWTRTGYMAIILDAYTIYNLESDGVEFPSLPINGENFILFLDEFTLEMVESLRLQIRISDGRREAWGC